MTQTSGPPAAIFDIRFDANSFSVAVTYWDDRVLSRDTFQVVAHH